MKEGWRGSPGGYHAELHKLSRDHPVVHVVNHSSLRHCDIDTMLSDHS